MDKEMKKLHVTCVTSSGYRVRLRCLPYFMLIGFPKCATTDFSDRIKLHPQIHMGIQKELFWWDHFRLELNSSLSDYSDFFDSATAGIVQSATSKNNKKPKGTDRVVNLDTIGYNNNVIGEMTTLTMSQNAFWKMDKMNKKLHPPDYLVPLDVYKLLPDVRLIVMMRNPVDRLYSYYNMWINRNTKTEGTVARASPEDFHIRAKNSIDWWKTCIEKNNEKLCLHGHPDNMPKVEAKLSSWWPGNISYSGTIREGLYALYIEQWLQVFPEERFLFLKTEDYAVNMARTFTEDVFPFLNVPQPTMATRKRLGTMTKTKKGHYQPMLNTTKTLLSNFYAPYNERLSVLLADSKWLWKI